MDRAFRVLCVGRVTSRGGIKIKDRDRDGIMSRSTADLVAVIELGTTSIRMEVAQIGADGNVSMLDFFQQSVSLGRDTFTKGKIDDETIAGCVEVLRSFKKVLDEYGIKDKSNIKALATSAVREALNRDAFLDRIYIATGITVDAIDDPEVNRLNCLAVSPILKKEADLRKSDTMVVEVGGGNTEVLMFEKGRIFSSHVYRIGSLRLQKMFENTRLSPGRLKNLMQSHVKRSVEQMIHDASGRKLTTMLALGGDARFAGALIGSKQDAGGLVQISTAELTKLMNEIIAQTPDELVQCYHMAYPDAETLGPALMIYESLARELGLRNILVGTSTLREGALADLASEGAWSEEFVQHVVYSAGEVGEKYEYDKHHAEIVASFSLQLFDVLQAEHRMSYRYKVMLHVAALLHDIGTFVSTRSHHKHSMYLISNSGIFGFGSRDLVLISLVARYHRRAVPRANHEIYNMLSREDRIVVAKLTAILRVADALDRRHLKVRRDIDIAFKKGLMVITVKNAGDLSMEQHGLREKANLFEQVYGMKVELQSSRGITTHEQN